MPEKPIPTLVPELGCTQNNLPRTNRTVGREWQDDAKGNTINHNTNALIALDPR